MASKPINIHWTINYIFSNTEKFMYSLILQAIFHKNHKINTSFASPVLRPLVATNLVLFHIFLISAVENAMR